MRVWIVLEGDYDGDSVTAVYNDEALAQQHADEMGGWVAGADVLTQIAPEVVDPNKIAERAASVVRGKIAWEEDQRIRAEQDRQRANWRPRRDMNMNLCKCPVFNPSYNWINDHGYCTFCGGFTIDVFREYNGEDALRKAIGELAVHDREKMYQLAFPELPPPPDSEVTWRP